METKDCGFCGRGNAARLTINSSYRVTWEPCP